MKKVLNKNLTLFYDKNYPYKAKKKSSKTHLATLGIGGNIGNTRARFQKLFLYLLRHSSVDIVKTSPILKNPAFGYENQEDFYNAIIIVKTNLNPDNLLKFVLRVATTPVAVTVAVKSPVVSFIMVFALAAEAVSDNVTS